jgi:DNA uptake protein ComE-like DNA-binding protein
MVAGLASQRIAVEPRRPVRVAGLWYFPVVVLTAGTFAWVPFLHAARRLRTPKARLLALVYGAVDVVLYVLLALTPKDSQGSGGSAVSTIGGLLVVSVVIVGCIQLASLRRMALDSAAVHRREDASTVDPAVKAVLAARARREDARRLAAKDPLLARELRIGRPDMTRDYDDGGLVDLNSAPGQVIAEVSGIPLAVAASIVDARARQGGRFANVDEVFVVADLPLALWDQIRDRAIVLI